MSAQPAHEAGKGATEDRTREDVTGYDRAAREAIGMRCVHVGVTTTCEALDAATACLAADLSLSLTRTHLPALAGTMRVTRPPAGGLVAAVRLPLRRTPARGRP